MHERDQTVRLAAAELRVQPEDRGDLTACAAQAPADVGKETPQPTRGIGRPEERFRPLVLLGCGAADYLCEISGEVGFGDRAGEHIGARRTKVENGRKGHGEVESGASARNRSRRPMMPGLACSDSG